MDGIFRDRRDAGQRLAQALQQRGYQGEGAMVLGIPRGGVPVADEVARALHAPLDVVISRKLRAPYQAELAIGAVVSSDSVLLVSEDVASASGAGLDYLAQEIRLQRQEVARRLRAYRGDRPLPDFHGRTVIVVDDGIATGYTFRAALTGIRQQGPTRLVAAVPVAPAESLAAVAALADDVVCLATPEPFWAVGAWYADFSPIEDEDVIAILERSWAREQAAMARASRNERREQHGLAATGAGKGEAP
jgi:putative phosphoribosyl transferase